MSIPPITRLSGPDRVRKRPAVIFGSDDADGVAAMLGLLIDLFVIEAKLGFCRCLSVELHPNHAITLQCRDQGFALTNDNVWLDIFTGLSAAPRVADESFLASLAAEQSTLYGRSEPIPTSLLGDSMPFFDLAAVQLASQWMVVESVRRGFRSARSFREGFPDGALAITPDTSPNGTTIRFRPDPQVFRNIALSPAALRRILYNAAASSPGLRTILRIG